MIVLPWAEEPDLSIIIPSSSPERLRSALATIEADATTGVPFETIVVANGVASDVADELAAVAEGVRVVRSVVQRGVAGGYNLGRSVARSDLIVMMHDDVAVRSGWLRAWIDAARALPEAGVIGSTVLFPDGSLRGAGNVLWRDGRTSPPWRGASPPIDSFSTPRRVDYSASCSLLVRAVTWDQVGGLDDEMYPAYFVDVDLAMSARRHGWSVMHWPDSQVVHDSQPASGGRRRAFVSERNRRRFVQRWADELAAYPEFGGDVEQAVRTTAATVPVSPPVFVEPVRRPDPALDHGRLAEQLDQEYLDHLESALSRAESRIQALEQGHASWYHLGSRAEFRIGGAASFFESSGGHPAEHWGRWIGDDPFVIEVPLAPLTFGVDAPVLTELELEVTHFVCDRRSSSPMTVELDGVVVLEVMGTTDGPVRHRAAVPAEVVRARSGRHVTLTVRTSGASSPRSVGQSPDERPLAVGLVSMTLS